MTHVDMLHRWARLGALLLPLACALLLFAAAGCKKPAPVAEAPAAGVSGQEQGKSYNPHMADCNGFTSADAASILGLPAPKVKSETEELRPGTWRCTFESGTFGKTLSFNVSVAAGAGDASREMARYRNHLETVGGASPYKENLPNGAYSDIHGVGDDAVWTDMDLSLQARKGNVTVHVNMPKNKELQTKAVEKFLSTLK